MHQEVKKAYDDMLQSYRDLAACPVNKIRTMKGAKVALNAIKKLATLHALQGAAALTLEALHAEIHQKDELN